VRGWDWQSDRPTELESPPKTCVWPFQLTVAESRDEGRTATGISPLNSADPGGYGHAAPRPPSGLGDAISKPPTPVSRAMQFRLLVDGQRVVENANPAGGGRLQRGSEPRYGMSGDGVAEALFLLR
jgi:hypothetical protein